jgi:hypothetical protein
VHSWDRGKAPLGPIRSLNVVLSFITYRAHYPFHLLLPQAPRRPASLRVWAKRKAIIRPMMLALLLDLRPALLALVCHYSAASARYVRNWHGWAGPTLFHAGLRRSMSVHACSTTIGPPRLHTLRIKAFHASAGYIQQRLRATSAHNVLLLAPQPLRPVSSADLLHSRVYLLRLSNVVNCGSEASVILQTLTSTSTSMTDRTN